MSNFRLVGMKNGELKILNISFVKYTHAYNYCLSNFDEKGIISCEEQIMPKTNPDYYI